MIDHLLFASLQGALAVIVVWAICRLLPRVGGTARCWFWRLAAIKFALALAWAVPVVAPHAASSGVVGRVLAYPVRLRASTVGVGLAPARTATIPVTIVTPSVDPMVVIWLLGVGSLLLLGGFRWRATVGRVRRAVPDRALSELAGVPVRCEAGLRSPMVTGLARPTVLVPTGSSFEDRAVETAIAHEVAHVRRRDLPWAAAIDLLTIVFWFHPLVWLLRREHRVEAEVAADEMARSITGQSTKTYASNLLAWVESGARAQAFPAFHAAEELKRRFEAMEFPTLSHRGRWGAFALAALPLTLALVPVKQAPASDGTAPLVAVDVPNRHKPLDRLVPAHQRDNSRAVEIPSITKALTEYRRHGVSGPTYAVKTLDGGRIELLAVSVVNAGQVASWAADGTRLPSLVPFAPTVGLPPLFEMVSDGKHIHPFGPGSFVRQTLLRFTADVLAPKGQFKADKPHQGESNTEPVGVPGLVAIEQEFENAVDRSDLSVMYLTPPKPIGSVEVRGGKVVRSTPGTPKVRLVSASEAGLKYPDRFPTELRQVRSDDSLVYVDSDLTGMTLRVTAKTTAGAIRQAVSVFSDFRSFTWNGSSYIPRATEHLFVLHALAPSKVASLALSTTRIGHVLFRGVQLHPNR